MFAGCTNLVDLNIDNFNLSNISGGSYQAKAFSNCPNLSNNSLNSILKALTALPNWNQGKTLKDMGLTETQANVCVTLSNWAALANKGWITGY
jgi:surface protein